MRFCSSAVAELNWHWPLSRRWWKASKVEFLPFDGRAAEETAVLMAERRRMGRPGELRDTMIAGIAIARHATLATRNLRHFADLPVAVVDPWAG